MQLVAAGEARCAVQQAGREGTLAVQEDGALPRITLESCFLLRFFIAQSS